MKRIALATCKQFPNLADDDCLLIPILRDLGIEAEAMVWDRTGVDWTQFEQVIIRSCWDYHLRLPEFLSWLACLESQNVNLQNPVSLVRWNADKRYLRKLQEKGILIPETCWLDEQDEGSLQEILGSRQWDCAVVKPTVSAIGYQTRCISRNHLDELVRGPLMVQEFLPEIQATGEWSLVFIGGEYSHSVRKLPAAGDFRVQTQFGGRVETATAPFSLIDVAAKILSEIEKPTLYARVDGLESNDSLVLMEVELIEPVLFLGPGGAAHRLAQRIALSLES